MEQLVEGHSFAIVAVHDLRVRPLVAPVSTEIEEHLQGGSPIALRVQNFGWLAPYYLQLLVLSLIHI